jgi:hypothetical protein
LIKSENPLIIEQIELSSCRGFTSLRRERILKPKLDDELDEELGEDFPIYHPTTPEQADWRKDYCATISGRFVVKLILFFMCKFHL